MNKEFRESLEEKRRIAESINTDVGRGMRVAYSNVIQEYDKAHAPVKIPQFVADWLEADSGTISTFEKVWNMCLEENPVDVYEWVFDKNNLDTLLNASVNGYEVEEEAKYNVRVPFTETTYYYRYDEELRTSRWVGSGIKESDDFIFMEQQIKDLLPDLPKKYWEEIK
ncbi:DUF1642 domain-containing protein [Aerococcaceae bacterium WGS1372]